MISKYEEIKRDILDYTQNAICLGNWDIRGHGFHEEIYNLLLDFKCAPHSFADYSFVLGLLLFGDYIHPQDGEARFIPVLPKLMVMRTGPYKRMFFEMMPETNKGIHDKAFQLIKVIRNIEIGQAMQSKKERGYPENIKHEWLRLFEEEGLTHREIANKYLDEYPDLTRNKVKSAVNKTRKKRGFPSDKK